MPVAILHVSMALAVTPAQPKNQYAKGVDALGTGRLDVVHSA